MDGGRLLDLLVTASTPASSLRKLVPFGRAAVGMRIRTGTAVSWKEQLERMKKNAVCPGLTIAPLFLTGMEAILSGAEKENVAVRHCLKIGGGRQAACR